MHVSTVSFVEMRVTEQLDVLRGGKQRTQANPPLMYMF